MKIVIEKSAVTLPGLALHESIELADGTRIRDLLLRGGVAESGLYLLPAVNGESANLDRVLRDGDHLRFYNLSAGG
jgi:hypothetical protein